MHSILVIGDFGVGYLQAIQLGAVRVLRMLLITADYLQPYLPGIVCFGLDDKQVWHFVFVHFSPPPLPPPLPLAFPPPPFASLTFE